MTAFADGIGNGRSAELSLRDELVSRKTGVDHAYTIRYTRWRPATPKGKTIVFNHGLQSHRGWFNPTAVRLADEGYAVYAFDRIGSGESSGGLSIKRGRVRQLRGDVRSWELFLDTLESVRALASRENPDDEIVLWGNSYGAKIVSAYLFRHAGLLRSLHVTAAVLTSPGNYRNRASMPLPFHPLALLVARPDTMFPIPMVERDRDNGASWFVAPGPWFESIRGDALSLRRVTKRFYLQTRQLDRFLNRRPAAEEIRVPVFCLMVRDDVMMANEKMQAFLEAHARDSLLKYYRGGSQAKHFLLFTEDRQEAIGDILSFLDGARAEIAGAQPIGPD